ncbi:hypothetical protein Tco_1452169, partial [Tanacetum coccineum]
PAPKGKKSSITAEDNIIPDPDEAFKLGNCINLTMAEEQDEQRRVHETHERLVTEKTASDEESDEEEVEIKTLSSDDERTEPNKKKAESEKADEEIADEDIADDEVKDNEEVADKEIADKETTDDEKDNEEITYTDKDDKEMADTEKIDAEKIEEENVDEEQTGDDQANKDDQAKEDHADDNQARALIFVTQKKQLKLPPSISNLSLSSDYGNQFLNVSSNISLVGIIKKIADTKINFMLHVPVQQEIPPIQQTPLLDVLVSVIPEQTTQHLPQLHQQLKPKLPQYRN